LAFLDEAAAKHHLVLGYGASTKGNIFLRYCGITRKDLPFIAKVKEDKLGAFTPGTSIPIISEQQALDRNPDYLLVLPWAFRDVILKGEVDFIGRGGAFVFPLPLFSV
jgi:NDP-4-keto-2,6-dideoxyhexose 3-C-methyltransferase